MSPVDWIAWGVVVCLLLTTLAHVSSHRIPDPSASFTHDDIKEIRQAVKIILQEQREKEK